MRITLAGLLTAAAAFPALAAPTCSAIDPPNASSGPVRPVTAEDMIELRDIGYTGTADRPLSVSPDGHRLAFQLRQASLEKDDYCLAMIVLNLDDPAHWRRIDTGGELNFLKEMTKEGTVSQTSGAPASSVALWSSDSKRFAFLRRDAGVTQVWLADVDGGTAKALTHGTSDVEDFAWRADGRSLVIATRPGLLAAKKAIDAEAANGFHLDDRFFPYEGPRPQAVDRTGPLVQVLNLVDDGLHPASAADAARLSGAATNAGTVRTTSISSVGVRAALRPVDLQRKYLADTLALSTSDDHALPCLGGACRGRFRGMWWAADGTLYFLKADGWADSHSSLYRWSAHAPTPRQLLSTDDLISGCDIAVARLICAYEKSNVPRRIVSIDLHNGKIATVYDPNPEFRSISVPTARRLHWRNAYGIETFADLVLPPDSKPGERLPLVVTQYRSRGFLRGGVGDETPIPQLAQDGIAVLSLDHPQSWGSLLPARSQDDLNRLDVQGFADRRNIQSSIDVGLDMLIDQGVIDPARIGLSGLSDGASTVQFSLVNSDRFAAFSAASCCEEEVWQPLAGLSISREFTSFGFPAPGDSRNPYWDIFSVVRAADRINKPILVQVADTEYLDSLQPWLVLNTKGKAMDVYVYPDERHVKVHPQHRLAVYRREIAWFAFWLQGKAIPYASPAELTRWRTWRAHLAQLPAYHGPFPASRLPMLPLPPAPGF
jgi:dipeptidyl aminopeptidase/acylaminoacyl peptidase